MDKYRYRTRQSKGYLVHPVNKQSGEGIKSVFRKIVSPTSDETPLKHASQKYLFDEDTFYKSIYEDLAKGLGSSFVETLAADELEDILKDMVFENYGASKADYKSKKNVMLRRFLLNKGKFLLAKLIQSYSMEPRGSEKQRVEAVLNDNFLKRIQQSREPHIQGFIEYVSENKPRYAQALETGIKQTPAYKIKERHFKDIRGFGKKKKGKSAMEKEDDEEDLYEKALYERMLEINPLLAEREIARDIRRTKIESTPEQMWDMLLNKLDFENVAGNSNKQLITINPFGNMNKSKSFNRLYQFSFLRPGTKEELLKSLLLTYLQLITMDEMGSLRFASPIEKQTYDFMKEVLHKIFNKEEVEVFNEWLKSQLGSEKQEQSPYGFF